MDAGHFLLLAILPFAAVAFVLLLVSARFRLGFLVFGGLFILQGSSELDLLKLGYLLGIATGFGGALLNLRGALGTESYRLLRPVLALSALFGLLVLLSVSVSFANGTPATAWLRDAASYLLFAAVPLFVLDARSVPRKVLVAVFVIAGVLAVLSYSVEWLDRRGLADLPVTRIALPSAGLLSALYVFALSGAVVGSRGRWWWAALGALILALVWITASRADSVLLLLAALPVGLFAAKQEGTPVGPGLRITAICGAALLLTLALTQVLTWTSDFDMEILADRVGTMPAVSLNPGGDWSYVEREDQTRLAWRAFTSNPVLGLGPGHIFERASFAGYSKPSSHIDTALSFPAKFGVTGLVLLAALGLAYGSLLRSAARDSALSVSQIALVAYAVFVFLSMASEAPLEDKGFSFGLLFLLALSLPGERGTGQAERTPNVFAGDV